MFFSAPGTAFATSAAKRSTKTFEDDPLPILGLPSLENWFSASEAVVGADNITRVYDRKSAFALAAPTIAASPDRAVVGGRQALEFLGAQYLLGSGAIQLLNNFTQFYVLRPKPSFPTGLIVYSPGVTTFANGLNTYMFSNGGFRFQKVPAQQGGSAVGQFVAGANIIVGVSWNGTRFAHSINGVQGSIYTPATAGDIEAAAAFSVGAVSNGTGLFMKASLFDVLQFSADYHHADNAEVLSYLITKLKATYGIA